MKTMKKIIMIVLMTAALMITVSSCGGVKIDDIKGDWTVSTVNGKAVAEYTDSYEYANYKVTDKSFVYSGINADGSPVTTEYAIKMTDKGFEASSGSTVINVVYDAKAATLSFDNNGKSYTLAKGTSDLKPAETKETAEPVETNVFSSESSEDDLDGKEEYIEEVDPVEYGEIIEEETIDTDNGALYVFYDED